MEHGFPNLPKWLRSIKGKIQTWTNLLYFFPNLSRRRLRQLPYYNALVLLSKRGHRAIYSIMLPAARGNLRHGLLMSIAKPS
jgi:hypothetical protein